MAMVTMVNINNIIGSNIRKDILLAKGLEETVNIIRMAEKMK